MRKKKGPEKEPNNERWLLTYSDLITLLMIFFIVLYAMGNTDKAKYNKVARGLNIALGDGSVAMIDMQGRGSGDTVDASGKDDTPQPVDVSVVEETEFEELKNKVDQIIKENNLQESIETNIEDRGLVISIKDSLFFDSGKADVKPEFKKKLIDIGKLLKMLNNYIVIEGHTDNVPISTYEFKSNWWLAFGRAMSVRDILVNEAGVEYDKISPKSYGETRPVATNSTEEGRAKNRRVDILIMSSKYNSVESKSN